MHGRLGAECAAKSEIGDIGNHFVHVHVCLGARPRLPDKKRKVIVEFAVGNFLCDSGDRCGTFAIERAEVAIDLCRGTLDQAERPHNFDRHALNPDAKIMQ